VLGHEPLGVIEQAGSAVEMVKPGDRVVIPTHLYCGECINCAPGLSAACLRVRPGRFGAAYGYASMGDYRGAQAERLRVPYTDANCIPVPGEPGDNLEDDLVLLADAFVTGWHATELAQVSAGSTVAVFGEAAMSGVQVGIDAVGFQAHDRRGTRCCSATSYCPVGPAPARSSPITARWKTHPSCTGRSMSAPTESSRPSCGPDSEGETAVAEPSAELISGVHNIRESDMAGARLNLRYNETFGQPVTWYNANMAGGDGRNPSEANNYCGLSRRNILAGGTLAAALGSAGIYEFLNTLVGPPERPASPAWQPLPPEQYAIPHPRVIMDDGFGVASSKGTIPVLIPPFHNHIVTAKLNVSASAKPLQEAQQHLESVLQHLEQKFPPPPSGVGIVVSWGLPYFEHYIPRLEKGSSYFKAGTSYPDYLPVDLVTSKQRGRTVYALQQSRTFPSDESPPGFGPIRLEQNDVAVLLRSDSLDNIMAATNALFGTGSDQAGSLFKVTSIRRGFTGGGHTGQPGLARKLALAAGVPGAKSIPRQSPIFLGFTTTVRDAESSVPVSNFETLPGWTDQWPNGYFKHGTIMPLSHLFQDLVAWYSQKFPTFEDRTHAMFRPGISLAPGTITADPTEEHEADVQRDIQKHHAYGHNGSLQPVNRLQTKTTSNYGHTYPPLTAITNRGDFATLDNPFHYTSDPAGDHYSEHGAAGLHFLLFAPTTETFNRVRLAMDGEFPDGKRAPFSPRSPGAGLNSVVHTTHRQNFLIPPRSRRSFPLAEFLA
jgi:Alcohol dehydrogenase GroES-like domain